MNYFTKEELTEILKSLEHLLVKGQVGDFIYQIIQKLQSMIENYCHNHGHNYEFSLGRGQCEYCGESE